MNADLSSNKSEYGVAINFPSKELRRRKKFTACGITGIFLLVSVYNSVDALKKCRSTVYLCLAQ